MSCSRKPRNSREARPVEVAAAEEPAAVATLPCGSMTTHEYIGTSITANPICMYIYIYMSVKISYINICVGMNCISWANTHTAVLIMYLELCYV